MFRIDEKPQSRNVARLEAKDYWITCAAWDGGYGDSFEIGIRAKSDGEFWLVQAGWTERAVVVAGRAVVLMLDGGLTPGEVQSVVSP